MYVCMYVCMYVYDHDDSNLLLTSLRVHARMHACVYIYTVYVYTVYVYTVHVWVLGSMKKLLCSIHSEYVYCT